MKKLALPTINSVNNITQAQLNSLKKTGFCYTKIDSEIESGLVKLAEIGRQFFKKDKHYKKQYDLDDKLEGYINHKERGTENIERYAYRGGPLPEPLSATKSIIDEVKCYLKDQIGLPILRRIFEEDGIVKHYDITLDNHSSTLSFIHYPYPNKGPGMGLKAHKDVALITVLFIAESGLEVYIDQQWQQVDPIPGTVVVNLGNTLQLMTGKNYTSALHRVRPPAGKDRLSISMFLGPNPEIPLMNYKTSEQLYTNFAEFFEEQVRIVYPGFLDTE